MAFCILILGGRQLISQIAKDNSVGDLGKGGEGGDDLRAGKGGSTFLSKGGTLPPGAKGEGGGGASVAAGGGGQVLNRIIITQEEYNKYKDSCQCSKYS